MSTIYDWSKTPAANGSADAQINMAEGMPPSAVNDGIRQIMARVREYLLDITGQVTVGGTANGITVTLNSAVVGSYFAGLTFSFRPATSNTAVATLTANSIGAKPIRKFNRTGETGLVANDLKAGNLHQVIYSTAANSGSGAWILTVPAIGGLAAQDSVNNDNWSGTPLTIANGGTGSGTQSGARNNLGLGDAALDDIVTLAHGGTGADTAAAARTNLGLGTLATMAVSDLVYSGDVANNLNFPIGTLLLVDDSTNYNRNQPVVVRLDSDGESFTDSGASATLTGTWRSRGRRGSAALLVQRTA